MYWFLFLAGVAIMATIWTTVESVKLEMYLNRLERECKREHDR